MIASPRKPNPTDLYRMTVTPKLAGCYLIFAGILVHRVVYNLLQFLYDADRGNCNNS